MEKKRGERFVRYVLPWLAVCLWYGVIWIFSAQTGPESSDVSNRLVELSLGLVGKSDMAFGTALAELMNFLFRKAAHMGVFCVLTGLILWGVTPHVRRVWLRMAWAAGGCALLAALDEYHQTFVPGRSGLARDVFIDLGGGCLFLLVWWLIRRARLKKKRAGAEERSKKI